MARIYAAYADGWEAQPESPFPMLIGFESSKPAIHEKIRAALIAETVASGYDAGTTVTVERAQMVALGFDIAQAMNGARHGRLIGGEAIEQWRAIPCGACFACRVSGMHCPEPIVHRVPLKVTR